MNPTNPEDRRLAVVPGRPMGLALLAAGLAWGASQAIERIVEGPPNAASIAVAILEAGAIALGSGLIGMAIELAAAIASARLDREDRAERTRAELAGRAVAALERIAEQFVRPSPTATIPSVSLDDRARLLAEIDQALRAARLHDAGTLLDQFAARFPDDPALSERSEGLATARREALEGNLAEIQAARRVNDPARVLELYRGLGPGLELGRRDDVERELSRWFLEVIHRRLRGGRIQPDVVELATMVAETFARTVEGASLHASLPTLRRSVGLCPRCASPYAGMAAACPKCLGTAVAGTEVEHPETTPESDPEDDEFPPRSPEGGGPDADWVFYDDDDRDGPPRSA